MTTGNDADKAALWEVCYGILPEVSRTFAISILGLREPLKGGVCVGYLVCRILDTVEDAPGLSTARRGEIIFPFLEAMEQKALPSEHWLDETLDALEPRSSESDFRLMQQTPQVLGALYECPKTDVLAIVRWAVEMGRGMVEMSGSMGADGDLKTLPNMAAMDRYCYYIAGTVGYMLTDLFFIESPHVEAPLFYELQRDAEAFGLGLQKVNIVKDFRGDNRRGWCFIPLEDLAAEGLGPEDLVAPGKEEAVIRAIQPVMRTAARHLKRGWRYLEAIPVEEREIRLFLAYSLFFAVATLSVAVRHPERLVSRSKLKISRAWVASIMASCHRHVDRPEALRRVFEKLSRPLEGLLA